MYEVPKTTALLNDLLPRLDFIRTRKQEHLICFSLDSSGHILHRHTVYIGTVTQSFASPREIYARALKCFATSIIVAHNHPSGDVTPSEGDIEATRILEAAGELLGVHLQDHIIVGRHEEYSFLEHGLLQPIILLGGSREIDEDLEAQD